MLACPPYMAPEAAGSVTSPRSGYYCYGSDIWSAGCVLHELVTGYRPFDSWTPQTCPSTAQMLHRMRQRHALAVCSSTSAAFTWPSTIQKSLTAVVLIVSCALPTMQLAEVAACLRVMAQHTCIAVCFHY